MTGGDAPQAAPAMTRREKVIQRTKVGGTLAVCVAGLLYAASLAPGPGITLILAVVLSLWSLAEVRAMGLFLRPFAAVMAAVSTIGIAWVILDRSRDAAGRITLAAPETALDPSQFAVIALLGIVFAGFMLASAVRHGRAGTRPASIPVSTALIVATVAVPLLALYPIRVLGGAGGLAAYVVMAKVGDIAGYYFGNLMGKRKPFPSISPGKTVAGCNASLITGMLAGVLFAAFGVLGEARYGLLSGAALGAVINVLAQAGDLLESAYKRRAGVKDSGTTFGPSGGMFDLVDSLILSAPAAAALWPLLFH